MIIKNPIDTFFKIRILIIRKMWKVAVPGIITGRIVIFMKTNRPSNDPSELLPLEKIIELIRVSYYSDFSLCNIM